MRRRRLSIVRWIEQLRWHPDDAPPDDEQLALRARNAAFDAQVGVVIADEHDQLRAAAAELAHTGSVAIERPGGTAAMTVHRVRSGRWTYRSELRRWDGYRSSGQGLLGPVTPDDGYQELVVQLAFAVATLRVGGAMGPVPPPAA